LKHLLPDFGKQIHGYVIIPSALGEISMVAHLLVFGVRISKQDRDERIPVAA
jgi:hypothetical protein